MKRPYGTVFSPPDKQQGFTLLELMLVIGILSLLALGATARWQHYQQRLQLQGHSQQLWDFLLRAQAQANRYNQFAPIWFIEGETWCLGVGTAPPNCTTPGTLQFSRSKQQVQLAAITGIGMGFSGRRNQAISGHLVLANPAGRVRLVLSSRGRLRLCSEQQPLGGIAPC